MKTINVAKSIMGALGIVSALGLAACGAETGEQGAENAIGSTSEALTVTNASPVDALASGDQRFGAMSCVLHDSATSNDYVIIAGGFNNPSSPAALASVLAYDPAASASTRWSSVTVTGSLGTARGFGMAIQDPADSSSCYIIGGAAAPSGGAAVAYSAGSTFNIDKVHVTGSRAVSVTHTNTAAANLAVGRADLQVAKCGSNILVVGGRTTGTTPSTAIDILSGGSRITVGKINVLSDNTLPTAVYNFALAKAEGSDNFVAVGGFDGSAAKTDIQAITTGTACSALDTIDLGSLGTARQKLVAFPKLGTADTFLAFAGDASGASNALDTFKITSWTAGSQTIGTVTSATAGVATISPMLVFADTATKHFEIIGGDSPAGTTRTTSNVQQYTSGAFDTAATLVGDSSGVIFGAAQYIPSASKTYVVTGASDSSGLTLLSTGDEITP